MDKKRVILIFLLGILLVGAVILFYFKFFLVDDSPLPFETNNVLIKTVIKEGEISNAKLRITNRDAGDFSLKLSSLENIIYLNEKNFFLKDSEIKEIGIILNGSSLGVYTSSLIIEKNNYQKIIPIILEVQTNENFFVIDSSITSNYKKIRIGNEFLGELTFFNLKDFDEHEVQVTYEIKNTKNEVIISEVKNHSLGSKTSLSKSFFISKKIIPGNYIFVTSLEYKGFFSTSSNLFNVVDDFVFPSFFNLNFFILIMVLILFVILLLLFLLFYERNRLFFKLRKQHADQLKTYSKKIDLKEEEALAKAKNTKEKEKILNEFKDAKEKIIGELKKEQEKQKKGLEKLKESKDKKIAEKKMIKWNNETYAKSIKSAEISEKLKLKLGALEHAYSEGYISKASYAKGRFRLRSASRKLKRKSL